MNSAWDAMHAHIAQAATLRLATPKGLPLPTRIETVVVVGSTCAGKTTICELLRRSASARDGLLAVPHRFVTRPPRQHDERAETVHVSGEKFDEGVTNGTIAFSWTRDFDSGRRERYGFPPVHPGRLAVFSANNAIFANAPGVTPDDAFEHALWLGVCAPDAVRERRLQSRSPDLCRERPDEVACRLADCSNNVLPHVHVVVENHGDLERTAPADVARLIELIVDLTKP
jgi:ribose 1,5-bisphosphokinase PhnN